MQVWRRLAARTSQGQGMPAELYVSLVDALYKDARSLFIGAIAAAGTALVTALKTGEPFLYACSIGIVLVALVRVIDMRAYGVSPSHPMSVEDAKAWELRYAAGSGAHVALLGIWCLVAFTKTSDPFVHLCSMAMTIAYMIGVCGRNFASNLLVMTQIVAAGIPMMLAMAISGGAYYAIIVMVLAPFFMTTKFISDRLRRVLLDAVIASRDVSLIASRFDTALNNMPHGLCMFDENRKLVVSNRRLEKMLGIPADAAGRGQASDELVASALQGGTIAPAEADRLSMEMEKRLRGKADGELFVHTNEGRILALTFHPMAGGGSVVLFEDITDRRMAEAKINQLARYDSLTGLPNRASFRDQLDAAIQMLRRRGPFAVHFIDLDQFKQVNDTLGHSGGDELLCAVSARLQALVRETDTLARFGGDEFVILQFPLGSQKDAGALAERIVAGMGEPYELSGNKVVSCASVGIAIAPRDGVDADQLLKKADIALYRAKSDGRAAWRFFEQGMDVKAQARRALQLDLRAAIANDEFEIHYQPLVNLHSGRISTCEALLRWPHPQRGWVSPAEFIPVAEEMGLVVEIGNMVLERACMECARWPDDVRVAVNVSPIQFRRGQVAEGNRDGLGLCQPVGDQDNLHSFPPSPILSWRPPGSTATSSPAKHSSHWSRKHEKYQCFQDVVSIFCRRNCVPTWWAPTSGATC